MIAFCSKIPCMTLIINISEVEILSVIIWPCVLLIFSGATSCELDLKTFESIFCVLISVTFTSHTFIVRISFFAQDRVPFDEWFLVKPLEAYHNVITMENFMKDIAPRIWPTGQRIGCILFCVHYLFYLPLNSFISQTNLGLIKDLKGFFYSQIYSSY